MSTLVITFLPALPIVDDTLEFSIRRVDLTGSVDDKLETFKSIRSQSKQTTISLTASGQASNYVTAFNLDYSRGGLLVAALTDIAEVTITLNDPDYEFLAFAVSNPFATDNINNIPPSTFQVIDYTIQTATANECSKFGLSITTDELAVSYIAEGVEVLGNLNNPIVLDLTRSIDQRIELKNGAGEIIFFPLETAQPLYIDVLSINNTNVNVINSLSGATVTIFVLTVQPLTLEYSLNDIDWQSSNIFTGQADGNYTVYIRDEYGCKIQQDYIVSLSGTREPYLFISKANSIGFKEDVDWDGYTKFKNEENTLSYQELKALNGVNFCDEILFQTNDVTTIQVHTNFNSTVVKVRDELLNETIIPFVLKSANLNRFQKMDCIKYNYDDGKMGIYFENGNLYNEADAVIGTYNLGGNLPDMAIVRNEVNIEGIGIFVIEDTFYDDNIGKNIMLINVQYLGVPTTIKIDSIYNLLPFEVGEFVIDWSAFGPGLYDVWIESTDVTNDTINMLSENINIQDVHEQTLAIRYWGNNNRDVFYKYGIEHFIRIPYIGVYRKYKDENELNIGDLTLNVVESSLYIINEHVFLSTIKSIADKLAISLSIDNCFIQGEGYSKDGSITSDAIKNTNIIDVSCDMIKTNILYTNNRQGQVGVDEGYIDFNIPALITDGENFIKS